MRSRTWIRWLLLPALLTACSPLFAQRYNFKFYGEEEGLANLVVQVVVQDRAGFLWVGTQNGLFRYDGNRFAAFTINDGLPGSRIESLQESVDGTFWVGTGSGIARRAGDRFEQLPLGVAQGIVGRQGIATDAAGTLYLATERGLVLGTPRPPEAGTEPGQAVRSGVDFSLVGPAPPLDASQPVFSVYLDGMGQVWYGCGRGLCTLENGQPREVGYEAGLPQERWESILGDLDGNLWVRSERSLYRRAAGSAQFEPLPALPESRNTFPTMAMDPQGRLLVTTDRGLARREPGGWELVSVDDGLNTNDISAVVQDREGSIWLGLLGSGLARWLGYQEWQSWTAREGLSRSSVWSVTRDTAGTLWVGTQLGLNRGETGPDGQLRWTQQELPGVEMARGLTPSADGALWIAANDAGLVRLDPARGTSLRFGPDQGLQGAVLHVMIDRRQRLWISTRQGLYRSDPLGTGGLPTAFERLRPPGTNSNEGFVMSVEDAQGRVWATGDLGLVYWSNPRGASGEGQWRRFTTADGLTANMVAQVLPDTDGSVWVGYRDAYGISRLSFPSGLDNGSAPRVEHVTVSNGLRSDKSIFLNLDEEGSLWVGTDHGVDVYDGYEWRHFGRFDGLIWDDCNSNAFLADAGGVWIGTSRGLSRYDPRPTPLPSVPPPVVITSVRVGNQLLEPEALSRGVTPIGYNERSLQLRFAALTFVEESNVLFRYRLNQQAKWQETSLRELNYPDLPSGTFTLEIIARNAQGYWSAAPARFSFNVATPWWMQWWFRIGSVLLALTLILVMWRRRTNRLEAERYRLERAVTERTRELLHAKARAEQEKVVVQQQKVEIERLLKQAQEASELKSEFLANMSHEIRTPMNGVLGMTDLVLATPLNQEQQGYLEAARHSADSLLTVLNDILDFSKIEAGRLDLNPIDFSLRECLGQLQKMFQLPMEAKKIRFSTEVDPAIADHLVGDPDRLRQVLLNLVGNAVKFTESGFIRVTVRRPEADGGDAEDSNRNGGKMPGASLMLAFEVTDSGIGIPETKQQVIFESFRQADGSTTRKYGGTGLGLTISARLVELMGGSIGVRSEQGKGSTFHFTAHLGVGTARAAANGLGLRHMVQAVGQTSAEDAPAAPLRILLAEDNVINQRLATRLLEKRGHSVAVTGSGTGALEMLTQEEFDVVLMDVQMPDMDGLQATARVREREKGTSRHIPIIALTAHTMKGDRERCLEAGMDGYVTKPVNASELFAAVERVAGANPARSPADHDYSAAR